MPFVMKPIEEIKSIEMQPLITKVENATIDSTSAIYLFFLILFLYIFKSLFFKTIFFILKFLVILIFGFLTYFIFLT